MFEWLNPVIEAAKWFLGWLASFDPTWPQLILIIALIAGVVLYAKWRR